MKKGVLGIFSSSLQQVAYSMSMKIQSTVEYWLVAVNDGH
jgi:hypothetical protein